MERGIKTSAYRQPQVCQLNYCHKLSTLNKVALLCFAFLRWLIKSINDYTISLLNSTHVLIGHYLRSIGGQTHK